MKIYIVMFLLLISSSLATASDCLKTHMEAQRLKSKVITSVKDINADYGSNTDLLLKQYEKLTNYLPSTRRLSEISEGTLKYCLGKRFTKEIYYVTDNQTVFLTITSGFYKDGIGKVFQEKYIVPNDTWTQVANSVEQDILQKMKEIKISIKASVEKELNKETVKKDKLNVEKKELDELRELLNQKKQAQLDNEKLKSSIEKGKESVAQKTSIKANSSGKPSYKEGRTSFYVKKGNLFCLRESAFDHQISLLSEGVMEYASYCYETAYDVDVVMLDHGMLGKTKVKSVSQPTVMWVTTESVGRR